MLCPSPTQLFYLWEASVLNLDWLPSTVLVATSSTPNEVRPRKPPPPLRWSSAPPSKFGEEPPEKTRMPSSSIPSRTLMAKKAATRWPFSPISLPHFPPHFYNNQKQTLETSLLQRVVCLGHKKIISVLLFCRKIREKLGTTNRSNRSGSKQIKI